MNAHKKATPAGGYLTNYRRDDESEADMKNTVYFTDTARQRQRPAWWQPSPLTTLQARQQQDIMYPAARVQELRERGHNIVLNWVIEFSGKSKHRIGQYVLFAGGVYAA